MVNNVFMRKLSQYAREKVISLKSSGSLNVHITELLKADGIITSRSVSDTIQTNREHCRRIPNWTKTIFNSEKIHSILQNNDELTSSELRKILSSEKHVNVSRATIDGQEERSGGSTRDVDIANTHSFFNFSDRSAT